MEMKDLRYFINVVEFGSFTKAAANIYLSQPTLSKSIKKLEQELKVELFERSTRSLKLTDAGEIVYRQGLKILDTTNELNVLLDDLRNLPTGEIKFGIPPLVGTLFFPTIATSFGKKYPHVSLKLIEVSAKKVEALIDEGQVDVGIIVIPTDTGKFNVSTFIKEEFMIFTNIDHPLANEECIHLEQLRNENFIIFSREFTTHELIIQACEKAGFSPNVVYESSQWDIITELVKNRLGITMFPKSILTRIDTTTVKPISIDSSPMWELGIITKKDRYQSFAVKTFLQFLEKEFHEFIV